MEKRIKLEDGNSVIFRNGEGAFVINKGYFENGEISKIITMSITDDMGFEAFDCKNQDREKEEISFFIPLYDPLYKYLKEMFKQESIITIDDDDTVDDNKKYVQFKLQQNGINISFNNRLKNESEIDKFNIGIINIMYDGRSKINQKGLDTKERLIKFFRSIERDILLKKQIEQEDER